MPKRYCVQCVLKKRQEPGKIKDKRRSGRSKNLLLVLSITIIYLIDLLSISKDLTENPRDPSGPSVDYCKLVKPTYVRYNYCFPLFLSFTKAELLVTAN